MFRKIEVVVVVSYMLKNLGLFFTVPFNIYLSNQSSHTSESQLIKLKDKIPIKEKTDVVYKIHCNDCDRKYIGETGRNLKTRHSEHHKEMVIYKAVSYLHSTQKVILFYQNNKIYILIKFWWSCLIDCSRAYESWIRNGYTNL